MDYEIEPVYWPGNLLYSEIATLTGLEYEEIDAVCKHNGRVWNGQSFVRTFNRLGFNTNKRFVKFDPNTIYPCMIRLSRNDDKYWHSFAYYKGKIYHEGTSTDFDKATRKIRGKYFLELAPNRLYKISSMLQVWI